MARMFPEFSAAMAACRKAAQTHADQYSNMEGRRAHKVPPLTSELQRLREGESVFSLEKVPDTLPIPKPKW